MFPFLQISILAERKLKSCRHSVFHSPGATESSADVHELLGTNVIGMDEECPGVGIHELAELGIILQN